MFWKRSRIVLIGILFLVVNLAWGLIFSGEIASDNIYRLKLVLYLEELVKPRLVEHTQIVTPVEIIGYPKPALTVDDKILRDLNCPYDERGVRYCDFQDGDQAASLGCSSIMTPAPLLGGLLPAYPMAVCFVGNGKYVYQGGCYIDAGTVYIIERQGSYVRIDSLSELRATYAPIESDSEALSYAMAATGYTALYGAEILPFTEYYVERLEYTHVEERGSEYVVRLFDYQMCGCGQHETIAVDVAVSIRGDIREIYRELVFRDNYEKCID